MLVRPELAQLRVVSGGARLFAGLFTGSSFITIDLVLTDAETDTQLIKTRIKKEASGFGGFWSLGQTDENLLDYMANIVHQYMVESY